MFIDFLDSTMGKIIGFLGLGTFIAVVSFGISLFKVPKIVNTLIINNREHPSNGYGKHYADRYIDIWYKCSNTTNDSNMYGKQNFIYTRTVDIKLQELGLIEMNGNDVKAIETLRNKVIAHRVKKILIKYQGDKKSDYDFRRNIRESYIKKIKSNLYE